MPSFGPFELVKRLGAGTCAEVYLARGPNAAAVEPFALKTFLPHVAPDERSRKTLLKDLEPARKLRHPGIVELYETGEQEGRVYLAMELVRGQPVGALVRKMREAGKALSLAEACFVISQAASALDAALELEGPDGKPLGLLHRNLNPQNVLIGAGGEVKLTDFGVARTVHAAAQVAGELKDTLAFQSPEQLQKKTLDRRSDVFSLGAILWELLTGRRLFNGQSEEEITEQILQKQYARIDKLVPSLPREVVEILDQALQRDRERRVPAAGVLADVLTPFTTPETQKKLGSRIETLFEPFPQTLGERSVRQAKPGNGEKGRAAAARPVVPIQADATMRDHKSATGAKPKLPEADGRAGTGSKSKLPGAEARAGSGARAKLAQARAGSGSKSKLPDPDDKLERDRAVLVHPLLAARPARRKAKLGLPEDDGIDHRIGYSEGTVSRLLRLNHPQPRKMATVWGVLGATLLIVFALWAYTRVGINKSAVEPPVVPEQAPKSEATSTPRDEERPEARRPTRGTLQLQSDVPAFVRQGGKDLGMTPLTLTLPAGNAKLELRTPDGTLTTAVTVQVPAGGEVTRKVRLQR
ncbi:MAG: protein kinase [Myxococcota bacterium]|nr:protein kinase [Myxococcota bacterium]